MARQYHRCHFCGGEVSEERVTVDYRCGDRIAQLQSGRGR
jgi:hypothetical protein